MMSSKKENLLKGYKLKPFYILKKGDLVKVKEWNWEYGGMLGLVVSREDYGTSCMVLLACGKKKTIMNFCLEKVDNENEESGK